MQIELLISLYLSLAASFIFLFATLLFAKKNQSNTIDIWNLSFTNQNKIAQLLTLQTIIIFGLFQYIHRDIYLPEWFLLICIVIITLTAFQKATAKTTVDNQIILPNKVYSATILLSQYFFLEFLRISQRDALLYPFLYTVLSCIIYSIVFFYASKSKSTLEFLSLLFLPPVLFFFLSLNTYSTAIILLYSLVIFQLNKKAA